MQPPEFKQFSTRGTAKIFGVAVSTIYTWMEKGLIEPTRVGRSFVFTERQIQDCRSKLKTAKARAVSPNKRPAKNQHRVATVDHLMHGITDHDY